VKVVRAVLSVVFVVLALELVVTLGLLGAGSVPPAPGRVPSGIGSCSAGCEL
jgi:hypothetical protein